MHRSVRARIFSRCHSWAPNHCSLHPFAASHIAKFRDTKSLYRSPLAFFFTQSNKQSRILKSSLGWFESSSSCGRFRKCHVIVRILRHAPQQCDECINVDMVSNNAHPQNTVSNSRIAQVFINSFSAI